MGRIIWIVLGVLLLGLYGSAVVLGRETTVWSVANAAPAPVRTFTASVLRGATTPIGMAEGLLGMKFGQVDNIDVLLACDDAACIRDKEKYLGENRVSGLRGRVSLETDGSCVFWAQLMDEGYSATQISLLFIGKDGQEFATAEAPVEQAGMEAGTTPYMIDPVGCVFARNNTRSFRWELLSVKGFSISPGQ